MKQPTAEDLGNVPGIAGARPVGTYDVDAYARGAHQMAAAGTRFGEDVSHLGEAEAELAARRARTEFTAAHTRAVTGLMGLRVQRSGDPDYKTLKTRWMDAAAKVVDGPAETISDELTRLHYYDSLHAPLMQEARNVSRQAFQGAADAHAAHREQLLTQIEQNLSTDPDDALSTAAIDSVHSNIDDAVDKRFITPDAALAEKKAAALRIAAAGYRKRAAEDPARAIDELMADESPNPLVKHLASATHDALVALAQNNLTARMVDGERNTALDAKTRSAAAYGTERTYIDEAFAGTPHLGRGVANDYTLTPESRGRLLLMLRRTAQPDPPAAVSQATTLALLDRIGRDDGDPEKISDRAPVLDAYNDGHLRAADYRFVANHLDDSATRGAVPLADEPGAAVPRLGPSLTVKFPILRTKQRGQRHSRPRRKMAQPPQHSNLWRILRPQLVGVSRATESPHNRLAANYEPTNRPFRSGFRVYSPRCADGDRHEAV